MSITPPAASGGATADIRKEFLETRKRSFWVKDVAHTMASETFDKRGRRLGLIVVILTTIVGTSAFASLKGDPSTAAKVAVGVLSVLAALAAAIKEYQGYEQRGTKHESTARGFRKLRYRADELLVVLLRGGSDKEMQTGIVELDANANELEEPPLPKGYYTKGEEWVDKQVTKHMAGGVTDVL
jgi:hypothetical protein